MLPMTGMSGATPRTSKLTAVLGSSIITRCDPSIIPIPSS